MFVTGDKLESGHYTVMKELGHGGMGVVYHCFDELLQRDVAIKMLLPELMTQESTVETFHQEARLAAQLEHPNIVTIYDIGKEERKGKVHHYMCMEYLPGGNLSGRIAQSELSIEHRLNWMKQLATGLSFAHKRNVVHQDIKADNIFITQEGDLKIGDFGLARIVAGRVRTRSVAAMGTPAYMSPELCRGEPQDHRSDIYSMGVLFYELATGDLPYKAKGMIEMAMKHASAPIPSARKANAQIPEVLDKVIQKMLAKIAPDRYQSMSDVLAVLDDLIFELRLSRLGLSPKTRAGGRAAGGTGFFSESTSVPTGPEAATRAIPQQPPPGATQPTPKAQPERQAPAAKAQPAQAAPPINKTVATPPPKEAPGQTSIPNKTVATPSARQPDSTQPVRGPEAESRPQGQPPPSRPAQPPGARTSQPTFEPVSQDPVQVYRSAFKDMVFTSQDTKLPPDELSLAWTFATQGPIGWNSGPVTNKDGSVVYTTSSDGRVYAVDALSGDKVWTFETQGPLVSSPVVDTDKIVVAGTDKMIYALSTQRGMPLWKYPLSAPSVATPAAHQDTVFVSTMDGHLLAIDMKSGFLKWQTDVKETIVSSPQFYGNSVFFSTKEGTVFALSAHSGQRTWKTTIGGAVLASPMASSDSIYVGNQLGAFYALDISTGRVIWEYQTDRPITARGVIVFTSVIFCGHDRWLYCCDKYDGRLMWKSPVKGRVFANLATVAGSVHAVTREGWVQSFAHKGGQLRWQYDAKRRVESPPCAGPRRLYLATVEGEILAFNLSENMAKLAG